MNIVQLLETHVILAHLHQQTRHLVNCRLVSQIIFRFGSKGALLSLAR